MADLSSLKTLSKKLAVLGLGVSGQAVCDACLQSRIPFDAWDDNETRRKELTDKYPIVDFTNDLASYAVLVPAAGIKPTHPVLQRAKMQNVQILSDIDLLIRSAPDARVIGVTGTNGKSTTTALIGHILSSCGVIAAVGGNIGKAACSLPFLKSDGVYVLELSSYQLEITAQPICDIAVFLNLAPDHLDWHGDLDTYFQAKKKITLPRPDRMKQHLIIGMDTPLTAQLANELTTSSFHVVTEVSTQSEPKDGQMTVRDGKLYEGAELITDLSLHTFLRGAHNHENIAAAYAATRAYGLEPEPIIKAIMKFEGLPHRQKKVAQWRNVAFINDSKATNADATARALASFENIYWILGGLAKTDELDGLDAYYAKIHHAFLIGDAASRFAELLQDKVPYTICATMDKAVRNAFLQAQLDKEAATILLSPACASFDQYKNFEQRGDDFVAQVQNILQSEAA